MMGSTSLWNVGWATKPETTNNDRTTPLNMDSLLQNGTKNFWKATDLWYAAMWWTAISPSGRPSFFVVRGALWVGRVATVERRPLRVATRCSIRHDTRH